MVSACGTFVAVLRNHAEVVLTHPNRESPKSAALPSRFRRALIRSAIDLTKWPAPIVRLYLRQITAETVLVAANDGDAKTRKGRLCEFNFYSGELALQGGSKDDAARLFRLAVADCPKSFAEFIAANAELKELGTTR